MLKDGARIKEITTSTGTGALTLEGAPSGYRTFLSEIGDTNTCFYWLEDANIVDWEMGIGTVSSTGPTLERTTVLKSTNSDAAINLTAGTHTIVCAPVPGYPTSNQNFQDLDLQRANLKDYSEQVATPSISANALTLDCTNGNVFSVAHNANITTLTLSNPPASGRCGSITLILTQDATGGRTIAFPASVKWPDGAAPTISTTANKENVFVLFTVDGGTTWRGSLAGKAYA